MRKLFAAHHLMAQQTALKRGRASKTPRSQAPPGNALHSRLCLDTPSTPGSKAQVCNHGNWRPAAADGNARCCPTTDGKADCTEERRSLEDSAFPGGAWERGLSGAWERGLSGCLLQIPSVHPLGLDGLHAKFIDQPLVHIL